MLTMIKGAPYSWKITFLDRFDYFTHPEDHKHGALCICGNPKLQVIG